MASQTGTSQITSRCVLAIVIANIPHSSATFSISMLQIKHFECRENHLRALSDLRPGYGAAVSGVPMGSMARSQHDLGISLETACEAGSLLPDA